MRRWWREDGWGPVEEARPREGALNALLYSYGCLKGTTRKNHEKQKVKVESLLASERSGAARLR